MQQSQTQAKKVEVKQCYFCVTKDSAVDWKDTGTLSRFISSYMKIAPRRRSGLCATHQRQVARAIKRARTMALMPYIPE